MILHVNHLQPGLGPRASALVGTLLEVVEQEAVDPRQLSALRVHLDWIQYRASFRDAVTVRRAADRRGARMTLAEIAVDLRQADDGGLREALRRALAATAAEPDETADHVVLDEFRPLRESLVWALNRVFWQWLGDWEAASGRSFEAALPSGRSDANHPQAVADSVADFWTLLVELDKRGQLPPEIFALEIGVGAGTRARLWLDRFRGLDEERGSGFYGRLRFLLGDYSLPTLDRALGALDAHRGLVSVIAMDALNPMKALAFLRYKILYVHLTNVYDNLPADELVRRDGRLYLVEARPYVSRAAAARLAADHGVAPADLPAVVARLADVGPTLFGDRPRGV
ncbi:MAG TPA: hypothetical protein VFX28_04090, partial [Methylomirabilota bacterium]|nr:hypothetical protein [Methylomirabilota bacterium]